MDYEKEWSRLVTALRAEYPRDPIEWIEDAVSESLDFTRLPHGLTPEQELDYLLKTSRRKLYHEHGHHLREPLIDLKFDATDEEALHDQLREEARELIEWGLSQLPERTAKIIREKRFEKRPLHEVALDLGMKTKTVQTIFTRGMRKLRDIISIEWNGGGVDFNSRLLLE